MDSRSIRDGGTTPGSASVAMCLCTRETTSVGIPPNGKLTRVEPMNRSRRRQAAARNEKNIQHSTFNVQHPRFCAGVSFEVGRWKLNVERWRFPLSERGIQFRGLNPRTVAADVRLQLKMEETFNTQLATFNTQGSAREFRSRLGVGS